MDQVEGQVVIYGKPGHAEVVGLNGQTDNRAIIVEKPEDIEKIDSQKPVRLFAQTTRSIDKFLQLGENIREHSKNSDIRIHDTICRQVSGRVPRMREFAVRHDVIVFVGGKKSSNARILYDACLQSNPRSYFISFPEELDYEWFSDVESVGICGATSTPLWLMEQVKAQILNH